MAGPHCLKMGGIILLCSVLLSLAGMTEAQGNSVPVITDYSALRDRYMNETEPLGYILGTIRAYDPDGTAVKYYLRDQGGEYLSINENTGVVTLKKLLDFETDIEIKIIIRVVDGDNQATETEGKIFVLDQNDNPPKFFYPALFKSIREDARGGLSVVDIIVTDRDTNNAVLQVTCEGATQNFRDACDTFELRRNQASNKGYNGTLYVRTPSLLDYEKRNAYNILLRAFDGRYNVTNEVHIEIIDINDSPPRWILAEPKVIDEERPIGTSVQRVSAEDGDQTNPRAIVYELVGGNTTNFQIDPNTGVISNAKRLDYDSPSFPKGVPFDLVIRAREVINATTLGNDPTTTATVSIKVTVRDINDNSPTFAQPTYRACIDENIAAGTNIPGLQMTVTDIDSGTFNSFALTSLQHTDIFGVVPTSDQASSSVTLFVISGQRIDYEKGDREFVVEVRATENMVTTGIHTGSTTVTICVNDVNDETPEFDAASYFRRVPETTPGGTLVIDVNATDPEQGDFGTQGIRYRLYGNVPAHFAIDASTGKITIAPCATPGKDPCIDYEKKRTYTMTVSATDNLGNGNSRSIQLVVNITDVNDNAPQIDSTYTRYINEGSTVTINPLVIQPVDPDTVGGPIRFSIQGDSSGLWQISSNGNITARSAVPYPPSGEYKFAVVVEDQQYSTTAYVTIIVIDINNNAPQFVSPLYVETINETTTGGYFIIKVTASDLDAPTTGNGVIDFYIEDGALGKFTITNVTQVGAYFVGDVYTTPDATFNYETQKVYNMQLRVRDRGSPNSLSGTARLIVNIADINNKNPQIRPSFATINVLETTPIDTSVHTVTATDPDEDNVLEFSMVATDAVDGLTKTVDVNVFDFRNLFRIDKDTGEVRVNAKLDRDVISRITFNITVVDIKANPRQTGLGTLLIRILESNDQAPQFDFPLYNITIDEELNLNSFVQTLNCRDEDDKIASYSLSQDTPRTPIMLSLLGGSGAMIVTDRIDYESVEVIYLTATCYDTGQPTMANTTSVIVNIRNINDNSPIFNQQSYRATIVENTKGGTLGLNIGATDADKGDYGVVRFRLDPTDPNSRFFSIDNLTGEITILPNATFDREKTPAIGFEVIAYDSPLDASVRRETRAPVQIVISDVNDNCPIFSKSVYTGVVPESAGTDTDIIDIIVTDADEGDNSEVEFNVKPGSGNPNDTLNLFGIGRINGRVVVKGNLKGRPGLYTFNVTATDMRNEPTSPDRCTTEVPVEVTVQESDNDAPEWIRPPQRDFVIYVLEEQYEGMLVYSAKAVDTNTGPNGVVDYFFTVDGNQLVSNTPEFRINRVTGVIRAEIVFDREFRDSYFLTLMARDRGNPAASSETTITVIILDVDDNDPEFPMRNGQVETLTLPERDDIMVKDNMVIPPGGLYVGQCKATDKDSATENNRIYYDLLADDVRDYIRVDRNNCSIYLLKSVDYEKMSQLNFDIYAYNEKNDDAVIREKRAVNPSILPVVLNIEASNDNEPGFTQDEYLACVSIDAPYGEDILEVLATDPDAGDNSRITYSLSGGSGAFEISPTLGMIRNVISFRQESGGQSVYEMNVVATDGGYTTTAQVKIFVTTPSNVVKLKVNRPLTDVETFRQQLVDTLIGDPGKDIAFACIDDMKNHVESNGEETLLATDVYVTAVKKSGNSYVLYSGSELASYINSQRESDNSAYNAIYITDAEEEGESDSFILEEDAVLAILIICILLIVLAIILFIVACICIRNSNRRKKEKLRTGSHPIVTVMHEPVTTSTNPVYHNAGHEPADEYATVQKVRPGGPIQPVVFPAPENLQPVPTHEPHELEPAEPEPPMLPPDPEPEPVIETEVMGEPVHAVPVAQPYRQFEPEYEDKIDTEIVDRSGPPSEASSPPASPSPPGSHRRSSIPSNPPSPVVGRSPSPDESVHVEVIEPEDYPAPPPPPPPAPIQDDEIDVSVRDDSPQPSPQGSLQSSPRGSPQPSPRGSPQYSPRGSPQYSPRGSPQQSPRVSPQGSPQRSPQPSLPPSPPGGSPHPSPPPSPPGGSPQPSPPPSPRGGSPQPSPRGSPQPSPPPSPRGGSPPPSPRGSPQPSPPPSPPRGSFRGSLPPSPPPSP